MPLNANIPLSGSSPDFGSIFRNRREAKRQNQLLELAQNRDTRAQAQEERSAEQAANSAFDERGQRRFQSVIQGAAELAPIIQRGDEEAARQYLTNRKSSLEAAIEQGVDVDTTETDEALAALDSGGIEALGSMVNDTLIAAQTLRQLQSGTNQAKPSAILQAYDQYKSQGGELPFVDPSNQGNDFVTQFSRSQVGAQYGTPTDIPGRGTVIPSRTTGELTPVTTEEETSSAEASRAAARTRATAAAENEASLPDSLADIQKFQSEIEGLLNHPGFNTIYGLSRVTDPRNFIPGTAAADAEARRNQLDAASFGIAIQKMRGLGQLSDAEGKKVSDAFTRATNPRQSEEAAREAWSEVQTYLELAYLRARLKAGQVDQNSDPLGIRQ